MINYNEKTQEKIEEQRDVVQGVLYNCQKLLSEFGENGNKKISVYVREVKGHGEHRDNFIQ